MWYPAKNMSTFHLIWDKIYDFEIQDQNVLPDSSFENLFYWLIKIISLISVLPLYFVTVIYWDVGMLSLVPNLKVILQCTAPFHWCHKSVLTPCFFIMCSLCESRGCDSESSVQCKSVSFVLNLFYSKETGLGGLNHCLGVIHMLYHALRGGVGVGVWRSITEYCENSDKKRYRRVGRSWKKVKLARHNMWMTPLFLNSVSRRTLFVEALNWHKMEFWLILSPNSVQKKLFKNLFQWFFISLFIALMYDISL